jgi:SAM-dependent methyltransferase
MSRPAPAEAASARRALEEKLAELFAAGPRGAARVLEVACGTGAGTRVLAASLAAHLPRARRVSLDIDPAAVAAARASSPASSDRDGDGGGWVCADLLALPLADASVDYVVALNIFHGIDRRRFGVEMHRVLRPEGRVLLYDRVPRLLPVPRFALIVGREALAALARLPAKDPRAAAGNALA